MTPVFVIASFFCVAICFSNLHDAKHNWRLPRLSDDCRLALLPESGLAVTAFAGESQAFQKHIA
jgi:hypothetical protein